MSFKQAFLDALRANRGEKQLRANIIRILIGVNPVEAAIIGEALDSGLEGAAAALGEALDSLGPRLRIDALPLVLQKIPENLTILNNMVIAMVLLGDGPTSGCDCVSCEQKRILHHELDALEQQVKQEEQTNVPNAQS